jgi:hypothetical protein
MEVTPNQDVNPEETNLPGHTIGFVDSPTDCDALTQSLQQAGFPDTAITVLRGETGLELFNRLLEGSLWGEADEDVYKQGAIELTSGHSAVCVEVQDADEAARVASISTQHGGHGIYHFGTLTDTRLTV